MTDSDYVNYQVALGQHIRTIRIAKDLSIRKLAISAEIEHHQLINIEKGRVDMRLSTLVKIAKALNIEISYLFISQGI